MRFGVEDISRGGLGGVQEGNAPAHARVFEGINFAGKVLRVSFIIIVNRSFTI